MGGIHILKSKDMTVWRQENIVSSYFYYMWNLWGEEECRTVFGPMHRHFWEKWCHCTDRDLHGAAERFYAELSDSNRHRIVERACELYDGRAECKAPEGNAKQSGGSIRRPVMVIRDAPQSLASLFMAEDIPFAYSREKFIIFDSSSPAVCKEYLERRGVPQQWLARMTFSQREIGINDIPLP